MKKTLVYLTDDELLQLDGKCTYGVQKIIDKIKHKQDRIEEVLQRVDMDNLKKQAITHCLICRDSVSTKKGKTKNGIIVRLSGYYLGRTHENKPILVCDECMQEHFQSILNNINDYGK